MNLRSITINLLLTTLSGGVVLQALKAQAASITFGAWNFTPAIVEKNALSFAYGNSSVGRLEAFADTTPVPEYTSVTVDQYARATISLSSFFTVTPGLGEKKGDKVKGYLFGSLIGILEDSAIYSMYTDKYLSTVSTSYPGTFYPGTFNAQVDAEVDAGFAFYRSGIPPNSGTSSGYADASTIMVNDPFSVEGILTIGDTYAFNMKLAVSASKTNSIRAISHFRGNGRGLTANVRAEAVPEPITILGSATALGFGAFFKREHSKKRQRL